MKKLREDLITILEFYKSFGIESIPIGNLPKYPANHLKNEYIYNHNIDNTAVSETIETLRNSLTSEEKTDALKLLMEEIGDCQRCRLSNERKNIVFGEGSVNTPILFIGEAPGREEDIQGRPFVGQAGQILTSLINNMGKEMGFKREDVFIANIVKCRPPMNRDPQPDEIASCIPFLNKQIEIICPEVIISLGRISTHTLMGLKAPLNKFSISEARGKFFDYKTDGITIPVMPTFHPAYFLRNRKDKHLTWSDALAVLEKLKEE